MKKTLLILGLLHWAFISFSQNYPPDNYRSETNPYYWKNRKPHAAYWQQDVYYNVKAKIDEQTNIIEGAQTLTYWNNSPDELPFVFFHLYQNAFQPDSYLDDLQKHNNVKIKYGKYESERKGTEVLKMQANGKDLRMELDNTILKVFLEKPLKSGESITFTINFKTYFDNGNTRRRMKIFNSFGNTHFDGVHWYPRISVYDAKFGWDTQQHLGKEFYGDFGTFDVELDFSDNYVVEATGVLQNKKEVLPDDLRAKLDIKNFARKPWNEKPSVITPYDAFKRKTWIYHAENVHDFAFTADPTYRIGETWWNGVQCVALVQEPHAAGWRNAAEYTAKVIEVFSTDFGMYAYPKMVVADAQDGMEYPMLTLDGGFDPDYRQLFAHEIGHNWFFGMVGNNETYRAMLDEGFTQFLTRWAVERIDGKYTIAYPPRNKYVRKHTNKDLVQDSRTYYGFMIDAVRDNDEPLNTASDAFNGALGHGGGYRHVYYKTATMLYNLQYVLGDSLFLKAMQNYFNQWKICHPYVEDFRNSVINFTKVDLNWFFDQWIETTKHIDYGVKSVKKGKQKGEYKITFERSGRMQMPIDFSVITKKDSVINFHIPNTWFVKDTKATVLPKWFGWDKIQPTYTATVTVPGKIKDVKIDPTYRLADVNMLDNSKRCPVKLSFDSKIYNMPNWRCYSIYWRPDIWYNGFDGIKAGLHVNGNYFASRHFMDANLWYNTGLGQQALFDESKKADFDKVNFRFNYRTPMENIVKHSAWFVNAKFLDGLAGGTLGAEVKDKKGNNRFYTFVKSMYRRDSTSLNYLLYPNEWMVEKWNNTLNLGLQHTYSYSYGNGDVDFNIKTSALGSDYNFTFLTLNAVNKNKLHKLEVNTRLFGQYGFGSSVPFESALYLAGANGEQMMDNKFTRAAGIVANDWTGYGAVTNHFAMGGGLGLRGYAGYLVPVTDDKGLQRYAYKGTTGIAYNMEVEFDEYIKLKPRWFRNWLHIDTYIFGDAGMINWNRSGESLSFTNLKVDAGLGTAITIKKFGALQTVDPLTIRFDMPFFLNNPPYLENEYFKFRWVVGISKSF